jgi:acetyl esterase
MMPFIYFLLLITIACTLEAFPYPPEIPQAKEHVYKKTLQGDLRLWVFTPKDHCSTDARPAVVFFFGGGWKKGSPAQFVKQCEYLASRGMVAITTDYRVLERHKTKADSCVKDGKSAIRWVRENAEK